jgi:hypothetical protein
MALNRQSASEAVLSVLVDAVASRSSVHRVRRRPAYPKGYRTGIAHIKGPPSSTRHGFELHQLGPGVGQSLRLIRLGPAGGDQLLEAVDLIDERLSSDSDGPVTIRIHDDRLYRASSFVYVYGLPYA